MPDQPDLPAESTYHLAPALGARVVGGLLVLVALLLGVATVVVAVAGLPIVVLVLVVVVGLGSVAGAHLLLRRVPVVRLGQEGYQVRLVRGAGTRAAAWAEVAEAVTTTRHGQPVVELRLPDERTTTVPVAVLDADREAFVRDLQAHLQRGRGLRPL